MKNSSSFLKIITSAAFAICLFVKSVEAQTIPISGNIFSSSDTVAGIPPYNVTVFPLSSIVDQSPSGAFVFSDDFSEGTSPELLSISGFNSAIDSLSFYSYFGEGRTAPAVTIYYSSISQNSLSPADYTELGAYTLPTTTLSGYTTGSYVNTTTYSDGNGGFINYDTLGGLNIPAGTQSILLQFTPQFDTSIDPGTGAPYGYFGSAFSEIQAQVQAVPEPSSWAMILFGFLSALGFFRLRHSTLS